MQRLRMTPALETYEQERRDILDDMRRYFTAAGMVPQVVEHRAQPKKLQKVRKKRAKRSLKTTSPSRRSTRLLLRSMDEQQLATFRDTVNSASAVLEAPSGPKRPSGTLTLASCFVDKNSLDAEADLNHFKSTLSPPKADSSGQDDITQSTWSMNGKSTSIQLQGLNIRERWKVTPSRIYSLCFNDRADKVLACAGDKWGTVGILDWTQCFRDEEADDDQISLWQFQPHVSPINCLKFNQAGDELFSISYDGSLRKLSLAKEQFEEIYADEDDVLKYLDLVDEHEVLFTSHYGTVTRVDLRVGKSEVIKKDLNRLRTIDVQANGRHFCTASYNGEVNIWDPRSLRQSVATMRHGGAVNSAFFSPKSNYLLSSSMDNFIYVWALEIANEPYIKKQIPHDNHVGRWLTNFRPVWHPTVDNLFFTGSMQRPRIMEVYNSEGKLVRKFGQLLTVCSISAWHKYYALLCGANSSGYLTFFA